MRPILTLKINTSDYYPEFVEFMLLIKKNQLKFIRFMALHNIQLKVYGDIIGINF